MPLALSISWNTYRLYKNGLKETLKVIKEHQPAGDEDIEGSRRLLERAFDGIF
jgi:hypothetical protein